MRHYPDTIHWTALLSSELPGTLLVPMSLLLVASVAGLLLPAGRLVGPSPRASVAMGLHEIAAATRVDGSALPLTELKGTPVVAVNTGHR